MKKCSTTMNCKLSEYFITSSHTRVLLDDMTHLRLATFEFLPKTRYLNHRQKDRVEWEELGEMCMTN